MHEKDPQTGAVSSDPLDPPQGHLHPVELSVHISLIISLFSQGRKEVDQHIHAHVLHHIQNSNMNHNMNEWTHHHRCLVHIEEQKSMHVTPMVHARGFCQPGHFTQ